jgi:hypothetical protein
MPLGLNILVCGEDKRLPIRNLDRLVNLFTQSCKGSPILIVRVNGAKPMITVGDDNLRVGGISYQQQRRQLTSLDSDVTKGIRSLFVFEDKFCWGH